MAVLNVNDNLENLDMNRVTLIGHLTADAEVRALPSGGKVANLRMATNESWTDKASGERKTRAEFHRLVTYAEPLIDAVITPYCKKGKQIAVEGQIRTRKWTDQSGQDKWITEIVLGPRAQLQLLGGGGGGKQPAAETVSEDAPVTSTDDVPW